MKPATVKTAAEGPVRVEFQVQFSRGPKGRRKVRPGEGTEPGPDSAPVPSVPDQDTPAPTCAPARQALPPLTPTESAVERVPKVTLLLVLGHHFERLVRDGVVKDYAEIAGRTGLSRARVSQIVDLTLLAPEIQEGILSPQSRQLAIVERSLRPLTARSAWTLQQASWRRRTRSRLQ